MSDLEKEFESAALAVLRAARDPGNDVKLRLYAHYKQAKHGDAAVDAPAVADFVARAKHGAWAGLRGMGREDAMRAYIRLVERVTRQ
jgi:acyl-CoA-binding protein